MTVWVNGELVGDGPAVRADDHGFTVGDGVFETMKVVGGRPFALSRHLRRLAHSGDGLGLDVDMRSVLAGIDAVLATHPADEPARLRVTVTGGPAPFGSSRGAAAPTVVVALVPLSPWPDATVAVTVPWCRNERAATAGLKTTSYADNVVALAYAHERGADEALFPNTAGQLCEGTGSNVFVAVGGRLLTPPLSSGCLGGITRELLLEWLPEADEQPLPMQVLAEADEVFLTSSTRDVQPVARVDGRELPGTAGPLTRRAGKLFAERAAQRADP